MYIQRRHSALFAFHDIPADAQKALGKRRFSASLKTDDMRIAQERAASLLPGWLRQIRQARRGTSSDPVERDASFWRRALKDAPEADREFIADFIADEAREREQRPGGDPVEAERFFKIATGTLVRLDEHLDEYLDSMRGEAKTKDMTRATVLRFAELHPYVSDVQRKAVRKWADGLMQGGRARKTVVRMLSELRGYWRYLQASEAVSDDVLPFDKLGLARGSKKDKGEEWAPFEPADVVRLLRAAEERAATLSTAGRREKFRELADLIRLGMYTGARIESLCALPVAKVKADHFDIADDKTPAGTRQVPIHPKLTETVERLRKASKDGYLLSGLPANKYGDRSDAIGKRFGRLKTELGFGSQHVFHSIRKTVATLLDNAGVPENVAADLLGHEKPTMTYGLYSGGSSLAVKREALGRVKYPSV